MVSRKAKVCSGWQLPATFQTPLQSRLFWLFCRTKRATKHANSKLILLVLSSTAEPNKPFTFGHAFCSKSNTFNFSSLRIPVYILTYHMFWRTEVSLKSASSATAASTASSTSTSSPSEATTTPASATTSATKRHPNCVSIAQRIAKFQSCF